MMEFVKNYVSSDSDGASAEEENITGLHSSISGTDYFNLYDSESSDSDDENETKVLSNINALRENAEILSSIPYGPTHICEVKGQFSNNISRIVKRKFDDRSDSDNSCKTSRLDQTRNTLHSCAKHSTVCEFLSAQSENSISTSDRKTEFNELSENNASADIQTVFTETSDSPSDRNIFHSSDSHVYHQMHQESMYSLPRKIRQRFIGHRSSIVALQWCKEKYSHLLLSASMDSSLKVWDVGLGKFVREIKTCAALKAAKWSLCGTKVICGGFGKTAAVYDVNSGQELQSYSFENYVSSLEIHPEKEAVFLAGTKDNIFAFDTRVSSSAPIRSYSSNCQYVLDIAFLPGQEEFACSTEVVSHDCADRTIMVWDFSSAAVMSNQIYPECYTCPCIKVQPGGMHFVAQSNGNYIAMFSTKRPYKLKNKRYAGHEVAGYTVGCDFNTDGKFLASGDSKGAFYIYSTEYCNVVKKLEVKREVPTVQVNWHPVLSTSVATASWNGDIQVWR